MFDINSITKYLYIKARPKYRKLKWLYLYVRSGGRIKQTLEINPSEIVYGQKPESQFPARSHLGGYKDGDWDLDVIPVESHHLYQSYLQHFVEGKPWEKTPLYNYALEMINSGTPFRGHYSSSEDLNKRFEKCDKLFEEIKYEGYKSKRQLYEEGKIENILDQLDEITVNVARDGTLILNDGWHRFITARILKIPAVTMRLCVKHSSARRSN